MAGKFGRNRAADVRGLRCANQMRQRHYDDPRNHPVGPMPEYQHPQACGHCGNAQQPPSLTRPKLRGHRAGHLGWQTKRGRQIDYGETGDAPEDSGTAVDTSTGQRYASNEDQRETGA